MQQTTEKYPIVYACVNQDEQVREKSSSGGIFYLIAKYVIDKDGVVFGAKFDENGEVFHGSCQTAEDLFDFMGSKYTQSQMGQTYREVQRLLKAGTLVLFSGAPCQVYGLKAYLGREYTNLITVDFICHGVPSRKVWRQYLKARSGNREIADICFRDKTEGWEKFSLKMKFADGTEYRKTQQEDLFMKGFLRNIYLRPSCYLCCFKSERRISDITLADFWGVQNIMPELYDDKGTSLALVQSRQGEQIFSAIKSQISWSQTDAATVIKTNSSLVKSVDEPIKRKEFFACFDKENEKLLTLIERVTVIPIHTRIKQRLKALLKRIWKL